MPQSRTLLTSPWCWGVHTKKQAAHKQWASEQWWRKKRMDNSINWPTDANTTLDVWDTPDDNRDTVRPIHRATDDASSHTEMPSYTPTLYHRDPVALTGTVSPAASTTSSRKQKQQQPDMMHLRSKSFSAFLLVLFRTADMVIGS